MVARMPTPDFVVALRKHVGHDLLWLPAVTAVVLDADATHALLVRRSDNGEWAPVTGILDPGEQPAHGAVREVREEASVEVAVERLVSVTAEPPSTHINGDVAQYLDLTFRCRHVSGEARPGDDEAIEVAWVPIGGLPRMRAYLRRRVDRALTPPHEAWFER